MRGEAISRNLQKKFVVNSILISLNIFILVGFILYFILPDSMTSEFKKLAVSD